MSRKKTTQEYKEDLKKVHGNDFTVLGEYTGRQNNILVRCNHCGKEYEAPADSLLNGRGCRFCAKNVKLDIPAVQKELDTAYGKGKFTLLSTTYRSQYEPLSVQCNACHQVFTRSRHDLGRGQNCPTDNLPLVRQIVTSARKTTKKPLRTGIVKTKEDFQNKLNIKFNGRFTIIGDYKGMRYPVTALCHNCGQKTTQLAGALAEYGGCRICRGFTKSKGEMIIFALLNKNNIEFEYQKPIKPKGYTHALYVDFLINQPKKLMVEFDGTQHREPKNKPSWWDLGNIEKRDKFKDQWAIDNGYKIVRLTKLNLKYIVRVLGNELGTILSVPTKIQYGNWYLPIKEIDEYLNNHTYTETMKKFGIGEMSIKKITNLYK